MNKVATSVQLRFDVGHSPTLPEEVKARLDEYFPVMCEIANDDYDADRDWFCVEPDDVPDQPASLGPVRAPYAVKLNDPIVILKLPSFTVPWSSSLPRGVSIFF